MGYPIILMRSARCQDFSYKKSEKKCTKDVDDSAGLGYLLCMVTTTIYNGRLVRLGCKRWIVRDIAGLQVEIGVDVNGCDDYVLDILVGFDHTNVSEAQVEQIRSEIAAKQNEIMAIFGY